MSHKATAVILTVLIAVSAVPAAAMATNNTQQASAYSGTHVQFDVQEDAVANYQVNGETMLENVTVQSGSSGQAGGLFAGTTELSAVTSLDGSALNLAASANANATVSTSGSAEMTAHDNSHGILVVKSGGSQQAVVANLSANTEASAESDQQVSVTTENGTEGTFIVAGEGSVTVNENGDVSAKLQDGSQLVFRSYPDGKSDQSEQNEQLIASGKAAGELYVEEQDGEMVTDTVTYGQNTTLEAKASAENSVTMTADRASSEGKIFITSVSEAAVGSTSDLNVAVDGEAAAQASSYSELESAIGGDSSKYMVKQASSASADAKVYVAVNHFSERKVTMTGADSGTTDSGTDSGTTSDSGTTADAGSGSSGGSTPGFGVGIALVAVLGAALLAYRRQ